MNVYDQFHLWVDNLHDYSEKYRKPGFSQKVIAWNHQYVLCIVCIEYSHSLCPKKQNH